MTSGVFSGKSANERRLEIIANNIANASTPGFKAASSAFDSLLIEGATEPDQLDARYVNIQDPYIQFSDAPVVNTGNTFDLAIEGSGFFSVSTPGGTMYTRNGQFTLSPQKKIITHEGYPVLGKDGGISPLTGRISG